MLALIYWFKSMEMLGFSPLIRLYVVCDVFNGRSPESSTSPKLLLAISEYVTIILSTFVQRGGNKTKSRAFFFQFNQRIRELIFFRRCIKFNLPISLISANRALNNVI